MADTLTPAQAEKEFWDSLKDSNTGMLGLDQAGYHHQPMTGFGEPETGTIWFFSRDDTDFARDVAVGGQAGMFCYQAKDQKVQACIHGALSIDQDRARIDKYW
ncbi:MAG: pyridoxamine 5'-phosphate oxidase family protein, partial [Brevundimonas aurantiaca]